MGLVLCLPCDGNSYIVLGFNWDRGNDHFYREIKWKVVGIIANGVDMDSLKSGEVDWDRDWERCGLGYRDQHRWIGIGIGREMDWDRDRERDQYIASSPIQSFNLI